MSGVTFPLIPRRRVLGLPFGGLTSARRGAGSDVAGSRPYQPGDNIDRIDWAASARLSLARASDDFVVREHFAEEAPRIVVVCDRRPSMALFPEHLPWLHKPSAIRKCIRLISDSATAARGLAGYLDEAEGERFWRPPRSERELGRVDLERPFRAPRDTLSSSLRHLLDQRGDLPSGTFVFILSDFLEEPARDDWLHALERRLELVPVVIQDPVWEQSFPRVHGAALPFRDAETNGRALTYLTASEVEERRQGNERRLTLLLRRFRSLDMDPVLVSSHARGEVLRAFLTWADGRLFARGRR